MSKKVNWWVVGSGIAVGIAALVLTLMGNPKNMGFCIACFIRDIAGGVGMHGAAVVQYTYDAWGNILSTTGTLANTLGEINPLRYRGYVYDSDTSLQYRKEGNYHESHRHRQCPRRHRPLLPGFCCKRLRIHIWSDSC